MCAKENEISTKRKCHKKKRVVLQHKRKVQKNSLRSFNDDKQEASVADDCIDNGGFDGLFVIVIYIENRVLEMNAFSAPATKKWLCENCGTDNLFLCELLSQRTYHTTVTAHRQHLVSCMEFCRVSIL